MVILSTALLIRHLYQPKTVVFLHRCLVHSVQFKIYYIFVAIRWCVPSLSTTGSWYSG